MVRQEEAKVVKFKFSELSKVRIKEEPIIDGDGDGKYTANPTLGDVTPVPLGAAVDALIPDDLLPLQDGASAERLHQLWPNAVFRRGAAGDKWGPTFARLTGSLFSSDGRSVLGMFKRTWHADALVELDDPEVPRPLIEAMARWRSSFTNSGLMRGALEQSSWAGRMRERLLNRGAISEQELASLEKDAKILAEAISVELGIESYRSMPADFLPDGSVQLGGTLDFPLVSVAFQPESAQLFNQVGAGPEAIHGGEMFIFPPDTKGIIYDDTNAPDMNFKDTPVEGIASGKFRIVGKREITFVEKNPLGGRGRTVTRDAWVLEAVNDDIDMPTSSEKKVVVTDRPDLAGDPYGASQIDQPSGYPIRGEVADRSDIPETLYHISVDAEELTKNGVVRAGKNSSLLKNPQDQMVSLLTSKTDAKQTIEAMKIIAEAARIVSTTQGTDEEKRQALYDFLQQTTPEFDTPLASLQKLSDADLMQYFFSRRQQKANKPPAAFTTYDLKEWAEVDPAKIGIVEISGEDIKKTNALAVSNPTLVMGARGGISGELRVYGDLDIKKPETPEENQTKKKSLIQRIFGRKQGNDSVRVGGVPISVHRTPEGYLYSRAAEQHLHEDHGAIEDIPEAILAQTIFDSEIFDANGDPVSLEDILMNEDYYANLFYLSTSEDSDFNGWEEKHELENRRFRMALVKNDCTAFENGTFYGMWAVWRVTDKETGREYFIKSSVYGRHDAMLERLGEEVAASLGFGRPDTKPVNISGDGTITYGNSSTVRWTVMRHIADTIPDIGSRDSVQDFSAGFRDGRPVGEKASADLGRIAVMDYLLDNEDRHGGNMLSYVDSAGNKRVFPIDHGLIFGGRADSGDLERGPVTEFMVDDLVDFKEGLSVQEYINENFGNPMTVGIGDREVDMDIAMEAAKDALETMMAMDPDELFSSERFERAGVPLTDEEKIHLDGLKRIFIARRNMLLSDIDQLKILLGEKPSRRGFLSRLRSIF